MANFDDLFNNTPIEESGAPQLSKEEYAAKKKAEREEIFSLSDVAAQEVVTVDGNFQSFLDLQARLDRYSAVNALLIFIQNPDASRLGSFDYWKSQNGFVKPGQSGISILEPGKEYVREDGSTAVGYNVKKVFDISQIDTRKLKSAPTPTYTERQLLAALISRAPVQISGLDELPGDLGAMTNPDTGGISVRKGMAFADTFRSVAQELCCAEIDRADNPPGGPRFSAYCAAYILCKKHGVDTQNFSFEDAPGVFDGMDAQAVKGALSQIRDVSESISGRMARQLETQHKTAKSQEAR